MRTFRYLIRLISAFVVRFRAIILIGVLLGVLVFVVSRVVSPLYLGRSRERIGITGRYRTENLPDSILKLIGDGLTKVAQDGTVEPGLAEQWETPDKGKTWIFTLKEDIFWQDGQKVESDDIVYEFSDVEIERPDSKTIVFKLQDAFAPFPAIVSRPTFRKGLMGTGQWKVSKVAVAAGFIQELVLENEKKDKKILKFHPTQERTRLGFKLGEVDILEQALNPEPFDSWKTAEVIASENKGQVVILFFNTQDKILSDKSLRQALAYAIDKEGFGEIRALGPLAPGSWAYNPQVKAYRYSPSRAKELIEDLAPEFRKDLTIKLVSTPVLLPVAEEIARFWKDVDIKTVVQVASVIPAEFQAYLTILDIPKDPDQYPIWHSTQKGTNISAYANPRIDKLLEEGRSELNLDERRKIYLDFQRFLVEDSPAIFLVHPTSYRISRK